MGNHLYDLASKKVVRLMSYLLYNYEVQSAAICPITITHIHTTHRHYRHACTCAYTHVRMHTHTHTHTHTQTDFGIAGLGQILNIYASDTHPYICLYVCAYMCVCDYVCVAIAKCQHYNTLIMCHDSLG